jgi:hypothetical protein
MRSGGSSALPHLTINDDWSIAMAKFTYRMAALIAMGIIGSISIYRPAIKAIAHEKYSRECCHGTEQGGDCFALPIDAVVETATGWHVSYQSDKFGSINTDVPRDKKRDSVDGRFHFCAMYYGGEIRARCFYVPVNT